MLYAIAPVSRRQLALNVFQGNNSGFHGAFSNSMNGYLKTSSAGIKYLLVQLWLRRVEMATDLAGDNLGRTQAQLTITEASAMSFLLMILQVVQRMDTLRSKSNMEGILSVLPRFLGSFHPESGSLLC